MGDLQVGLTSLSITTEFPICNSACMIRGQRFDWQVRVRVDCRGGVIGAFDDEYKALIERDESSTINRRGLHSVEYSNEWLVQL